MDAYVAALVSEINLKANSKALSSAPIGAVYFGGGTPSILRPDQIRAIGSALSNGFDLTYCKEYSFEFEVKSVNEERVYAAKDIGVTHARFGAQTFSPLYRELFNLTATIEQIEQAAALLRLRFPYASCDVLYGMHGQDENHLLTDITHAVSLGLNNLDFYPINNLVIQPKLAALYRQRNLRPKSGLIKHYMNILIRESLAQHGFLPHNGHGYVQVDSLELQRQPIVTDKYSFAYHEHVLGFPRHDLLGFGVNAISSFQRFTARNTSSRDHYINALAAGDLPMVMFEHSESIDAARPVSLALPYHGKIPKEWIKRGLIPSEILSSLSEAIENKLIESDNTSLSLTRVGWESYSNLMHFLQPKSEQRVLQRLIQRAKTDLRRDIEPSGLEGLPIALSHKATR